LLALIVLGLLAAGAFAAWQWLGDDGTAAPVAASPSEVCRTPKVASPTQLPAPRRVSVTVGNGTDRPGLAVDTADELVAQGFDVADIGNTRRPIKAGVAQVRYGHDQLAAAITTASYVPRAELVEVEHASRNAVALWLGPEFDHVVSARQADPASVELPAQDPVCHAPKS
jgi:hypothetical protein